MIGQTVSHYRILEQLGAGGMGVVYKAEDLKLRRTAALKFLPVEQTHDPQAKHRFAHEAEAASALDHPNICTIYEIEETADGKLFIAMPCYEGETLRERIARGPLQLKDALEIAAQIAQGLAAAHRQEIVHRDIKPANIQLTRDGPVKILDFGLAKLLGQTHLTRSGTTLGTVAYMPPEQVRGEDVDRRADIWSLGAVLYEMITGRPPFPGDHDQAVLFAILNRQPEPPTALRSGLPRELERILTKALAKSPAARYQHADELQTDLRNLQASLSADGAAAFARETAAPRRRLRSWVYACLGLIAGLMLAYLIFKPQIGGGPRPGAPKPVAVITFENLTGDASYDYLSRAIPNLLITSLEQSPYLRVTTWERMYDLLAQVGGAPVESIDADLGFELCRRDGIEALVLGSFVKAGDTFATDVKVLDVQTKELLETASARGEGADSILQRQIDQLSKSISRGLGLSPRKIEANQKPVIDVTTSSLEAYQNYLRGMEDYDKHYNEEALRSLEKAVAIDSTFAVAYLYLGKVQGGLHSFARRDAAYEKAKRFSAHATERERLTIEAEYARVMEKDQDKGLLLLKELIRKYPQEKQAYYTMGASYRLQDQDMTAIEVLHKALELDPEYAAAANLLAYIYMENGDYGQAIHYFNRYASLAPGDANPHDSLAELYFQMGRLDDAIAEFQAALAVKPDFYASMMHQGYIHGIRGDYAQTQSWLDAVAKAIATPGLRGWPYGWMAVCHFLLGDLNGASRYLEQARQCFSQADNRMDLNALRFTYAWFLYESSRWSAARECLADWQLRREQLDAEQSPVVVDVVRQCFLGFIAIGEGQLDQARILLDGVRPLLAEAGEREPSILAELQNLCCLYEGELRLTEGHPAEAIECVGRGWSPAAPRLLNLPLVLANFPLNQDVLARAHVAVGRLDEAIAEYERLITSGPQGRDWRMYNPRYNYRLARLYEQTGQPEKACEQYAKFLALWRGDGRIPEFADARERLERLAPASGR